MIILIIGLGSAGKKHVAAIRQVEQNAIIYALRSSANAETYEGVINIFSLGELESKPGFVVIGNPTAMHKASLREVLQLGCPIFIEKPVFNNLDNVGEIIQEVTDKKLVTYIACNMRFHPAIQYLQGWLRHSKQRINEVNIYCGSYLPDWRPGTDFKKSYSANAAMGGGVHLDLIHELDYCTWLFGMPMAITALKTSNSSLNIDAIDNAAFQFRYDSFTATISLNYYRRDAKREIEIVMEDKTIVADLLLNRIVNKASGEVLYEEPFIMNDTYLKQMHYFISHIKQQQQPMNDIEEGVAVLKLALHE